MTSVTFLDCPAYLEGGARCALPAEVRCRFTMDSSAGPLEAAMIRCPAGHYFNGPIDSFVLDQHDPGPARTARDSLERGRGSAAPRPGTRTRTAGRPNSAPPYYLGRPARQWITVMRSHRGSSTSRRLMQAVRQTAA